MSKVGAFVVTGSGSGIGQAIALRLTQEGHSVFGLGRDVKKLKATAELLPVGRFAYTSTDLSDSASTLRAVTEIKTWLKQVHLPLSGLVNNAGVFDYLPFLETSDEVWLKQFQTNLLSAVRLTRELFGELKAASPSSVLNISSSVTERAVLNTTAYSAVKAGMNSWTQVLALEWASFAIRVNAICPGLVDTPIHDFFGQPDQSASRQQAHQAQPMGRMGTSREIAEAALFLLSPQSAWTTGSILTVDGGISL